MAVFINRQAPQSGIASLLALQGRGGDTELVHMTRPEVKRLQQSGLMSINPDTGLPEYFLGDVFDTVKASVKNIFKPENIIPAVASIALPAIAGPLLPAGLGLGLSPLATSSILSGAGTALGSLPFRDFKDSLSAGVVSGGLQFGTGKLKEFLGGLGSPSAFADGVSVEDKRKFLAERAREKYFRDIANRQEYLENLVDADGRPINFVDMPGTDPIRPMVGYDTAPPAPIRLENKQLQQLLSQPQEVKLTKAELSQLGRGIEKLPTPKIEGLTGLKEMTPVETRAFIEGEIEGADQLLGPTSTQKQAMTRLKAMDTNKFVRPESFDRFAAARKAFTSGDVQGGFAAIPEGYMTLDGGVDTGAIFGDIGRGLASVEATSLVDAVEAQRMAEEEAAQKLIARGVPPKIARKRVTLRRGTGEFGSTGAGLTAAEARRRAIEGGGFEFFGPSQFVSSAQGGLINLAAGGKPDFEGIVGGDGHGMEDNQIMEIKGGGLLAVSPKEYVVPADVMAMIGNGNPDDGADEMDEFISKFRKEKYGRDMQPPEMDGGKALQSLMS